MEQTEFAKRLASLPRERAQLLPALLLAQQFEGWVTDDMVRLIASHLRLTVNDVESVVTSYPDLHRRPSGQRVVRICSGASCSINGSGDIRRALETAICLRLDQTSPNTRVTLEETSCCFACAVAPVIEINGILHGRVEPTGITTHLYSVMGWHDDE